MATTITASVFKLTAYGSSDATALYRLVSTNPEITKWTILPDPYRLEDAEEFVKRAAIERAVEADKPRKFFEWAIRDTVSDVLIGSVGIHTIQHWCGEIMHSDNPEYQAQLREVMPEGEFYLEYFLDKNYYGRGIMTNVVKAVTDRVLNGIVDTVVFDHERDHTESVVRVPRLHAEYYPGNAASERVLLKNGFVPQGKDSVRIWRPTGKPTKLPWLIKTADCSGWQ